ncbi:MAG: hypothetical protein QOI62_1994 [Solirubrobacteraceae bacterium]|jgi:hypothetical protein|nr:hypothetical protein [Solirubrobacteraceae bacterium]MEA2279383.1 hypothetical protein [Solirubrobacteraceae bacterium]MEA2358734.1 hypothetical protein [Solirubrobacteraceae bacterium]MEA2394876.1 hypothetical protein [Solirubrobacteraceae bacterium]
MPVRIAIAAVLCAGLLAGAAAVAQEPPAPTPAQQSPQALFKGVLLDDPLTASGVKRLLRTDAGFVSPTPTFADLTGDGKTDAVVTVEDGGAAGAIAAYVLSADGDAEGKLHAVLRSQSLYQALTRVTGTTVTVTEPRFARGDDVCCATRSLQRDYAWDPQARTFTRRGARIVAGTR